MVKSKTIVPKGKLKASYYLEIETEQRIMEIYMKRLKAGNRVRKSNLIDEAIELLHKKEFKNNP